jgi:hypothetical protein
VLSARFAHAAALVTFACGVHLTGIAFGQNVQIASNDAAPAHIAETEAAVRRELARGGRPGALVLEIHLAERTLVARFTPERGLPLERTIVLPARREEQLRAAAFLAYNLVNDEASELLAGAAPGRSEESATSVEVPAVGTGAALLTEPLAAAGTGPLALPPPPPPPLRASPARALAGECDAPATDNRLAVQLVSPLALPPGPANANVAIALLYGDQRRVRGVSAGAVQRTRCEVAGVSAQALMHIAERESSGLLVAGVANVTTGRVRGVSVAGLLNLHVGSFSGASVALVNIAPGNFEGIGLGLVNIGTRSDGAQIGLINIGTKTRGAQLGLVNIATSVSGSQLGLVNVAGVHKGFQLGLVNVAKDAEAALGLVSVAWSRRLRMFVWTSNLSPIQLGVIFEGKRVFGGLNFGRLIANVLSVDEFVVGLEFGVHAYRSDDKGFIWDFTTSTDSNLTLGNGQVVALQRFGTRVGYRVEERFAPYIYGGVAVAFPFAKADPSRPPPVADVTTKGEFGAGVIF